MLVTNRKALNPYHLFPKELKSLQSPQGLCASLDILEHNVCLASHFGGLHGHNIEYSAVSGKKGVERGS